MLLRFTWLATVLLFSFSSVNAATVLPQDATTGEDGALSIDTSQDLFADPDNIYNFTEFNVASAAQLSFSSADPVYVYANSISIDGSLTASVPALYLVADNLWLNGDITVSNDLYLVASSQIVIGGSLSGVNISIEGLGAITPGTGTGDSGTGSGSGSGSDVTLIGGGGHTVVPLPASAWLFVSGLISLLVYRRRSI